MSPELDLVRPRRDPSFRHQLMVAMGQDEGFQWLTIISSRERRVYTSREALERIHDYCKFYSARGLGAGDTVLIILKESLDLYASFFAGIISGVLPAYFAYPSPKQSSDAFLGSIRELLRFNRVPLVVAFPEVQVALERAGLAGGGESPSVATPADVAHCGPARLGEVPCPAQEAFLQFSSGTTGAKKAVRISAAALANQLEAYQSFVAFDEGSRVVSWLPHYHDMGLIACILMPFLRRVPIFMLSPFEWVQNPRSLFEVIQAERGTHVWLPNFALGHLTRSIPSDEVPRYDLSSVRQMVVCSEPALHQTVEHFMQRFRGTGLAESVMRNCYAMAENTFAMTSTDAGPIPFLAIDQEALQRGGAVATHEGGRQVASVGRPLSNIEIHILGPAGESMAEDRVGEIAVHSNCMLEAYHNNPEATAAAFAGGFFRTGDLGFLHEGQLYVTGRSKDLIIVGGENIYPQDVEALLNAEEGLIPGRNVVIGIDDETLGTQRIVILAETHLAPERFNLIGLRTRIFDALNVSISEIILLPHMTLRKSTAGKVSRPLNKTTYLAGGFTGPLAPGAPEPAARSGPLDGEDLLAVVLKGVPPSARGGVTRQTPLFSSGLIDSFGFVSLVAALEKASGVPIPQAAQNFENFQTVACIEATLRTMREQPGSGGDGKDADVLAASRAASLSRLESGLGRAIPPSSWIEALINGLPAGLSPLYPHLLGLLGVKVGRHVRFLGKLRVKIRGKPGNIELGDEVILGHGVDLRNRENGRIVLRRGVYLDAHVRVVAARDGLVEVGAGTEIGARTVVNSGGVTRIGTFCMIAGSVNINSSTHGIERSSFIKEQPHRHGFVEIGNDVWIGAGAAVLMNSRIHEGAVISANALVTGEIPAYAICAGTPALVLRYR